MLEFDPVTHTYTVGGVVVPSVTQVLEEVGISDLSQIPQRILDERAAIGTAVHTACELWDLGRLTIANQTERFKDEILPYLSAWTHFSHKYSVQWDHLEQRIYHPERGYAGTSDRFGMVKAPLDDFHVFTVVDIKSGMEFESHRYQVAGYAGMYNMGEDVRRMCVYVRKDGTFRTEMWTGQQDIDLFFCAAEVCKVNRRIHGIPKGV